MAQTNFTPILTYKSDTASSVPSAGNLTNSANGAELAVNTADKRLFTKDSGGNVVELGTNPSSLTMPNGTANGVVYANGSKVLTSGSALTFDGTTFQTNKIYAPLAISIRSSTFPTNVNLHVSQDDSTAAIAKFTNTTTGVTATDGFDVGINASEQAYIWNNENTAMLFGVNNSEQMRLTSTGLGIGTSSPATRLEVAGDASPIIKITSTSGPYSQIQSNTAGTLQLMADEGNTGASTSIRFRIDAAEVARFDSAGNLGLGVTPSAWSSSYKAFQLTGGAVQSYLTGYISVGQNNYDSGTGAWKYVNTGFATRYQQGDGTHQWFNAASGTAGNAITFTQAMTLDANGLLQVGATSPINSGAVTFASSGGTYNQLELCDTRAYSSTPNSSLGFAVKYNSAGSYTNMAAIVGTKENATDGNYSGALLFYTSLNGSGSAERVRIDSSGNLLCGTTNTAIYSFSTATGVNINAVGTIGASSSGTTLFVNRTTSDGAVTGFYRAGNQVGTISVTTTATAYNTSSDYRLKNITGALTGYKERLMSLLPKQGTWIADGSEFRGFLAHEFANPYRASVTGEKDAVDADGKPVMQGMQASSSEVMADLVAMVKDLVTENESLKARLDAANL